ncbi:MAG: hypothetical protein GY730_08470, partial [bacterium]|nr:hypothetical protein [bacterium]
LAGILSEYISDIEFQHRLSSEIITALSSHLHKKNLSPDIIARQEVDL